MTKPKERNRRLTEKQRTYCELVISGVPKGVAALQAGYSKEASVSPYWHIEVSPAVQEYLKKLKEEHKDTFKRSIEENIQILQKIIDNDDTRNSDRLKAMQLLATMTGCSTNSINISTEVYVLPPKEIS